MIPFAFALRPVTFETYEETWHDQQFNNVEFFYNVDNFNHFLKFWHFLTIMTIVITLTIIDSFWQWLQFQPFLRDMTYTNKRQQQQKDNDKDNPMTCDTDYNSENWEPEFMTWQLRVTLDSIRNSCDNLYLMASLKLWKYLLANAAETMLVVSWWQLQCQNGWHLQTISTFATVVRIGLKNSQQESEQFGICRRGMSLMLLSANTEYHNLIGNTALTTAAQVE